MKKGTFQFIEQTLNDYSRIEQHINSRIEELKYPIAIPDENIGGSRSGNISNPTFRLAATITDDLLISNLNHTKQVVDDVLDRIEPDAKKVIYLYYIEHPRKYTWTGVASQTNFSEKHCRRIRDKVFEEIAKELGMPI